MKKFNSVNSEAFTPEDVEKGLHIQLINTLLSLNNQQSDDLDGFRDIRITTDGYCTIVEWCYNIGESGFEFVDYDERIMKQVELPDNTIEYAFDEEDAKELLANWLEEHPGWTKNQYGRWVHESEKVKVE